MFGGLNAPRAAFFSQFFQLCAISNKICPANGTRTGCMIISFPPMTKSLYYFSVFFFKSRLANLGFRMFLHFSTPGKTSAEDFSSTRHRGSTRRWFALFLLIYAASSPLFPLCEQVLDLALRWHRVVKHYHNKLRLLNSSRLSIFICSLSPFCPLVLMSLMSFKILKYFRPALPTIDPIILIKTFRFPIVKRYELLHPCNSRHIDKKNYSHASFLSGGFYFCRLIRDQQKVLGEL